MYKKNEKYYFHQKENVNSIAYSDGSKTENSLYDIICSVSDKSVWSEELNSKITDWPTEYHFSRKRHCLLRPLDIKAGDRVLELGCGCGAITRYLGELGAIVDSVEGTISRARIAGERCRDLSNVKIHVDNFLEYSSLEKYDWVLFIGVLEYAPLFSNEKNAIDSYIELAKRHLASNGQLVIAIENKLGLKYFNGCGEDHLNEISFGIENRYHNQTPVTFGKQELINVLMRNDFSVNNMFFPFPDYKLPSFIIHENAFNDPDFDSGELLRSCFSRDYLGKTGRLFEESLVWPELARNGIAEDLANSFLVSAKLKNTKNDVSGMQPPLAIYFNTERKKQYVTETIFSRSVGSITTNKRKITQDTQPASKGRVVLKESEQLYKAGHTLHTEIEIEWNQKNSLSLLIRSLTNWAEIVIDLADENKLLPAHYIDLTPFNIKLQDSEVFIFDQEWCCENKIPFHWILFRGVYWTLINLKTVFPLQIDCTSIIENIADLLGVEFNESVLLDAIERETVFLSDITGCKFNYQPVIIKSPERIGELHYKHLNIIESLRSEITHQQAVIDELQVVNQWFAVKIIRKLKGLIK